MENVNKILCLAFATILFCIGTYLMLYQTKQYYAALKTVRENCKGTQTMYQQYERIDEEIIPYGKLIATLYQPLEYDIRIDDVEILKGDHNREKIIDYDISKINYRKCYIYDGSGNITSIQYIGLIE